MLDSPSIRSAWSVSLAGVRAALTNAGRDRRTERRLDDGERRRRQDRVGRNGLAGGTCALLPWQQRYTQARPTSSVVGRCPRKSHDGRSFAGQKKTRGGARDLQRPAATSSRSHGINAIKCDRLVRLLARARGKARSGRGQQYLEEAATAAD